MPNHDDPKSGLRKTILLVEDEDQIRALVTEILMRSDYDVLAARDAVEARSLWENKAESVDLLLADMMLPGGTGLELALEFRKRRPDLKIIFASGNPRDDLVETTQMMRGSKLLLKPFSMKRLQEAVAEMLG